MIAIEGMASQRQKQSKPLQANDRKAVVVLGMHRGGTSALGGALQLLGVDFGQRLLTGDNHNKKGYWEHPEIVVLHDELLSSLGSRWDDDQPLPADWLTRQITRDVSSRLIAVLQRDLGRSSLFGVKDPRLCRLMPLWFPIFQALRVEPHFVLVVRHPWEVAESLAKRSGIDHGKSYLLWLEHIVQAESATLGYERAFVRYEEMVNDPVTALARLRKQLGVNLRAPSRVRTLLQSFLDPSLQHHRLNKWEADNLRQPVPQLALDFYGAIRSASTSRAIGRKMEPLVAQFVRARELFRPRIDLVEAQFGSPPREPFPKPIRLDANPEIRGMEELSPEEAAKINLEVSVVPREVQVSAIFWLEAQVTNSSNQTLHPEGPYPVRLAYHWIEKTTRQMVVFDGNRSGLFPGLDANSAQRYAMTIIAPSHPGEYILQTSMVQDGIRWFEEIRPGIVQEFSVLVTA
jgi:hypothetical protein